MKWEKESVKSMKKQWDSSNQRRRKNYSDSRLRDLWGYPEVVNVHTIKVPQREDKTKGD